MRLRRPKIDTDEVADRWQPRLYVRLIVLGLLVAYAIGFVLENRKQVTSTSCSPRRTSRSSG